MRSHGLNYDTIGPRKDARVDLIKVTARRRDHGQRKRERQSNLI